MAPAVATPKMPAIRLAHAGAAAAHARKRAEKAAAAAPAKQAEDEEAQPPQQEAKKKKRNRRDGDALDPEKRDLFGGVVDLRCVHQGAARFNFSFTTDGLCARVQLRKPGFAHAAPDGSATAKKRKVEYA